MKKLLFIIVSTTILMGCSNTEKHKKSNLLKIEDNAAQSTGSIFIQKYNDESLMDSLKAKVDKGDRKAFNDLQDIYFLTGKNRNFCITHSLWQKITTIRKLIMRYILY